MTTTPTPTPSPLALAERAERDARKAAKAAERFLANAVRDAVALSFKREGDGLERYAAADLINLGRLAIKADLERQRVRHARAATQAALLATPANPAA
jgi:hypothetical protein